MAAKIEYIVPDGNFVKQITNLGGESLKKCFQCGACSVVCSLSPYKAPFPRKEMIWTQWGLKDRLLKDPDVWLCHNCNDCSTYCPRGAKPGDILAAIRNYSIVHFAVPSFFAKAFSRPKYLPVIVAIPVIILFAFLWFTGRLAFPEGEIVYSHFIPTFYIFIGGLVATIPWIGAVPALLRFWKNISEFETNPATQKGSKATGSLVAQTKRFITNFISAFVEILKHSNFKKCEQNKNRYWAHLGLLYGAILYFISMSGSVIYSVIGIEPPIPLTDPVVIFGMAGTLLIFVGCTLIIYRRLLKSEEAGKATYFEWFFIVLVYLITIGAIVMMSARLAGMATLAYSLYLTHLVLAFIVVAYLPFSKFAHLLYRTLAMTYAKQIGREAATEAPVEGTGS